MRDAFVSQLCTIAAGNPDLVLLSGDLGFRVLDEFRARFPRQYFNMGVAEQNMAGVACGLALEGKTVFSYSIGNFVALRCLEQLRNGAAYHNANVTAVSIGAGFSYGPLGVSHHATEDMSIMRALPSVDVVSPGDDFETAQATAAVALRANLSYLRLEATPRQLAFCETAPFEFGRARILHEGADLTLVTTGGIAAEVLQAAAALSGDGIRARVLHYHSVRPFDRAALLAAGAETGGVITVEEHSIEGGLGGVCAETLLEAGIAPGFFQRIGIRSGFTRVVGSQAYLRKLHCLDADSIAAAVRRWVIPAASPNAVAANSRR